MIGPRWTSIAAGLGCVLALLAAGSIIPIDVRHSAPYGFSKTIDFDRLIAVSGGYVTASYDDFGRLDLDLRAYTPGVMYDLTVYIRPAVPGAPVIRTIHLDLPAERIFHRKRAFADPFVTVRFPPIGDSAGQTYYVWVERGPRNRDEVVALWSIKSYSRLPAGRVVSAFVATAPGGRFETALRLALILLVGLFVATAGWLFAAVTRAAMRDAARRDGATATRWQHQGTDGTS